MSLHLIMLQCVCLESRPLSTNAQLEFSSEFLRNLNLLFLISGNAEVYNKTSVWSPQCEKDVRPRSQYFLNTVTTNWTILTLVLMLLIITQMFISCSRSSLYTLLVISVDLLSLVNHDYINFFSRYSDLRNSSVHPFVCLSVCLSSNCLNSSISPL